ncbi:MAG: hypothetical protein OHK0053_27510 [Microscillaceae bacterium]
MNPSFTPSLASSTQNRFRFVLLLLWGFLLGVGLMFFNLIALGLFLSHYTLDWLPPALVMAGFVGFFISLAWTLLQNIVDIGRLALGASFLLALGLGLGYGYLFSDPQFSAVWTEFAFWGLVIFFPLNSLVSLIFEAVYSRLFNVREAKRYADRYNLGLILAGGLSLLGVSFWIEGTTGTILYLRLHQLLGLSALCFGLGSLILLSMVLVFNNLRQISTDIKEVYDKNQFFQLIENNYTIHLGLFMGLAVLLAILVDYVFWTQAVLVFQIKPSQAIEKQNLAGLIVLLARLGAFSLVVAALLKRTLFKWVVRRYGLRSGLLVFPITLAIALGIALGGYGWLGSGGTFEGIALLLLFVTLLKFVREVAMEAIALPSFRAYFWPVEANLRLDLQSKMEGGVRDIALWVAGLVLWLFDSFGRSEVGLVVLMLVLCLLLVQVILRLHQYYRQTLEETLNQQQNQQNRTQNTQQGLVSQMMARLGQIPPNQLPTQLNLLSILHPVAYRQAILQLMDARDGTIRKLLKRYYQQLNQQLHAPSSGVLPSFWPGGLDFSAQDFIPKISFEEELRGLMAQLDEKLRTQPHDESFRLQLMMSREALQQLLEAYLLEIKQMAIEIDEEGQQIALIQASKLCILEGIPLLDILMKSKYFPVLENAELIRQTYRRLRGAEFRLERIKYIRQLTYSKQIEERVFGALLTLYAQESVQTELLPNLLRDPIYAVRYQALVAASRTQSPALYYQLIDKLAEPAYSNAAFAALNTLGEPIFPYLENAYYMTGQKEVIQIRILQIYGRLATESSVEHLLNKLKDANQNLSRMALAMLALCGRKMKPEKAGPINAELREVCENLVWNLAIVVALRRYAGGDILQEALKAEIENNYEEIFSLLSLLYEPASVVLVRQSLNEGDPEKAEFARELLDILLDERVKPVLIPLLDISTDYETKIREVQDEYPIQATTRLRRAEALIALIQRDYKSINRWTKACALAELAQVEDFQDASIFVANIVNPHALISEIAYRYLYEKGGPAFADNVPYLKDTARYPGMTMLAEHMAFLNHSQAPTLGRIRYDIVRFMGEVGEFRNVPGLILAEIAEQMTWHHYPSGQTIARYAHISEMDYFLVLSGNLVLKSQYVEVQDYRPRELVHALNFINEIIPQVSLETLSESIVLRISREAFQNLLSIHEVVARALLRHIQNQYIFVDTMHQQGKIPFADTLALNALRQLAEKITPLQGEVFREYPFAEQLDHWWVEEGQIAVIEGSRKTVFGPGLVSLQAWEEKEALNLRLRAEQDSIVYCLGRQSLLLLQQNLEKVQFFRRVPGLRALASLTLLEIAPLMSLRRFNAGEKLATYAQGRQADAWMVIEGQINVHFPHKEKAEILSLTPRSFGEPVFFFENAQDTLWLEAAQDGVAYTMPHAQWMTLLQRFNQITEVLLQQHFPNTWFEMTHFLKQIPALSHHNTLTLLEMTPWIQVKYYQPGDRIASYMHWEEMDIYLVYSGRVQLWMGQLVKATFEERAKLSPTEMSALNGQPFRLVAETSTVLYWIRKAHFAHWPGGFAPTTSPSEESLLVSPETVS